MISGPKSTSPVGSPTVADEPAAAQAGDEVVVQRLVHEGRAERRAALPGRAEAAEQRALHGEVEVGVGSNHKRVLAAELEAGRLQVAAGQLADAPPDRGRPGEADLVDEPASRAADSPSKVVGPSACTTCSTLRGMPPCQNSAASAAATAGVDSDGFHTTALPHTSAGTRYHDGTATGKLAAVTIAATPTGTRNVNSCLSGISLGTVWP